ncbi:MAG: hypothetical protein KF915_20600 [Polyangiaceae bacterium]|nr:hypothetical protein [Polyangiaceae bacterium]
MIRFAVLGLVGTLVVGCGGGGGTPGASGGTAGVAGAGGVSGSGGNGGSGGLGGSSASGGSGGSGGGTCTDPGDCQEGVCDELLGRCVECLFETDCDGDARCVDRRCIPETTCRNSLDCVDAPSGSICDPRTGRCEQCVGVEDCDGTADCISGRCVPYTPCRNSLDCDEQICEPDSKRCVECVETTDCLDGKTCVANQCRELRPCQSDNQCTPHGQLCDRVRGVCADCIEHSDCPSAYHCAAGVCELSVCAEGSSRCVENAVQSCLAGGVGWGSGVSCGANAVCVQAGSVASCVPRVCDPDATYCDGTSVRRCAPDGLSSSLVEECPQFCQAGACTERECEPSKYFCSGQEARLCSADGMSSQFVELCSSSHYCDPVTTLCVPRVCEPGASMCSGNVATTCNANGSGPVPGGTDCASSGQVCSAGQCTSCPAGGATPRLVLDEVFTGDGDYAVIQNRHPTCSAALGDVYLHARVQSDQVAIRLPTQTLAPMEKLRIVETGGQMSPGAFQASQSIAWLGDAAGAALLCSGATCTAANVIDAMRWYSTSVSLPSGVSFNSTLPAISAADEPTKAFTRVGYTGASPSYYSADWTVGAASVPAGGGGGPLTCPSTQPPNGSACTLVLGSCAYGPVTCICFSDTWLCT